MIGALLLNVLLPNATRQLVNQVEAQIHRATGLSFDFNGDGVTGTQGANNQNVGNQAVGGNVNDSSMGGAANQVEGFDEQ